MPTEPLYRKRVEIPVSLYNELARDAKRLGMDTQALIVDMLRRTLEADRARAGVAMKDRAQADMEPPTLPYSARYDEEMRLAGGTHEQGANER